MLKELERLGRRAPLLHEYMCNGNLAQFLHEHCKMPECITGWLTRPSIAVGVAEGLAFLQSVAVIHLDISSGNVLLDANMSPWEYAYTMQLTAPGNVYSYSFALLEILTTRLPVDEAFGEGIDMVKRRSIERRDPKAETRCKGLAQFLYLEKRNAYSLQSIFTMHKSTPAKRPKMKRVVEMLQEMKQN
ncbi:LOW QUALITY PROTEIN: hypothetical protein Cgig2_025880 [Carnegiea gigantea]|uniref:Protein kinase domain-containing protein n=1 Tax=Carnegiea gigantea TaxID=171969 RepID=A0A9Q1K5A7_9CARY|nr:LOW QUALITY PROTEIN: hypothetical protein Cgig2_025880 [Carnegiea gigantea]